MLSSTAVRVVGGRVSFAIRRQLDAFWLLYLLSSLVVRTVHAGGAHHGVVDTEDNEFAEFEEFDEGEERTTVDTVKGGGVHMNDRSAQDDGGGGHIDDEDVEEEQVSKHQSDRAQKDIDHGVIEDDGDEFAHLQDEEEFEDYSQSVDEPSKSPKTGDQAADQKNDGPLKYADVPAHFRSNWTNYQVELLVISALFAYVLNYVYGKTKNQSLAYAWFEGHKDILSQQFAVVGDDGTATTAGDPPVLMKETDSSYSIWCSGRAGCQGMLVQLRLLKRQDLVGIITQMIRPTSDKVIVRVEMDAGEMDTFVMAVGQKRSVAKLAKDMTDLSIFTGEKKVGDKLGLPSNFVVFTEIAEATGTMIDPGVANTISKYEDCIEYFHFSDQYCGPKPQEGETFTKQPTTSKVLIFCFNIPGRLSASERHVEQLKPLMNLVFYCVEKVRKYRLTREGKTKADKNRLSAQEVFWKTNHQQRQNEAQARREEKTRERKQRMMEEENPEKQKYLEKQEQKRDAKMKKPKMKQLKMKA